MVSSSHPCGGLGWKSIGDDVLFFLNVNGDDLCHKYYSLYNETKIEGDRFNDLWLQSNYTHILS